MLGDVLSKKLLILIELSTGHYTKLDQIAEKIGITKQAVSDYMKKMRRDGMIEMVDGHYRVTPEGIDYIFGKIEKIESYLKEKKKKMGMIESFSAIAGNDIKKGERVGLFMKNGFLHAYRKKSGCYATAMEDANEGEDVALCDAEGIIDMKMGKIYLAMLPPPDKGGSKSIDYKKLRENIDKINADKIASLDVIGKIALKKMNLQPSFEFAPLDASINACERGLNVFITGSEKEIRMAISVIEEYNASSIEKIEYEVIYKY